MQAGIASAPDDATLTGRRDRATRQLKPVAEEPASAATISYSWADGRPPPATASLGQTERLAPCGDPSRTLLDTLDPSAQIRQQRLIEHIRGTEDGKKLDGGRHACLSSQEFMICSNVDRCSRGVKAEPWKIRKEHAVRYGPGTPAHPPEKAAFQPL